MTRFLITTVDGNAHSIILRGADADAFVESVKVNGFIKRYNGERRGSIVFIPYHAMVSIEVEENFKL